MSAAELCLRFKQSAVIRFLAAPLLGLRSLFRRRSLRNEHQMLLHLQELLGDETRVTVPSLGGEFLIGTKSDLFRILVTTGSYEAHLLTLIQPHIRPGRDAIDVGANIGLYTTWLAGRLTDGNRVLAIEPSRTALRRLRTNIHLNGHANRVIIHEGVASECEGPVEMCIISGREEYSSMGQRLHPRASGEQIVRETVHSSSIDQLVRLHGLNPGFIKIDVEGCENFVITGMREVLVTHRPVILIELSELLLQSNGSSVRSVLSTLKQADYDVMDTLHPRVPAGTRSAGEYLCVPRSAYP